MGRARTLLVAVIATLAAPALVAGGPVGLCPTMAPAAPHPCCMVRPATDAPCCAGAASERVAPSTGSGGCHCSVAPAAPVAPLPDASAVVAPVMGVQAFLPPAIEMPTAGTGDPAPPGTGPPPPPQPPAFLLDCVFLI